MNYTSIIGSRYKQYSTPFYYYLVEVLTTQMFDEKSVDNNNSIYENSFFLQNKIIWNFVNEKKN